MFCLFFKLVRRANFAFKREANNQLLSFPINFTQQQLGKMLVFTNGFTENMRCNGQIQVIFGPMFSGKTTELIRRMRRYQIANYKCLMIKYAKDMRYDALAVATHDSQKLEAVSATTLTDLKEEAVDYNVIGIDEGQFFPDVVSFSETMANKGKIVIIAALDGTFQRQGFGDILQLVPLAESVIKLTAVCMVCFEEASFTKRIGSETKLEVIGGTDKYMAVCRRCYAADSPTSKLCEEKKQTSTVLSKENEKPH